MPFKPLLLPPRHLNPKPKLLWFSPTPQHSSSFSLVSRELLERLEGFDIYYVAQHYYGSPVDFGKYKLLPCNNEEQLAHYVVTLKPQIIVLHHSPTVLRIFNTIAEALKKNVEKLVIMAPIEGYPMTFDFEPLFSQADIIITHSKYSQDCLFKHGFKSEIVYHGVSPIFKPSNEKPNPFTVGVVSSHVWRKQLTRIIDAHRIVRTYNHPVALKIYASTYDRSPWMPDLKRYAQITNPEAYFHETAYQNIPASYESMPKIYHQFTVLANPITEGFGLSCLEAMASGVVPITITHGACPEVVGDCGLYANVKDYLTLNIGRVALVDVEDLAEKIIWAYQNPDKLEKLAEKAVERAKTFSWEKAVEKLKNLIAV
ncbi:MAG: glycosyltransferase family 4 protein [Candidatus Norongarragalinales archaeon]